MNLTQMLQVSPHLSVMASGKKVRLYVHPHGKGSFADVTAPIAALLGKTLTPKGDLLLDGWSTNHYRRLVQDVNAAAQTNLRCHFCCALVGPVIPFSDWDTPIRQKIEAEWTARWKGAK